MKQHSPEADAPPRLTIATVVRNDAEGLQRTIDSVVRVRSTSSLSIAHVVVDGASDDGTLDVIERMRGSLDVWVSEPDKGIYDAMNKSARLAHPSSFIIWINAGDELLPLDGIWEEVPHRSIDALFCGVMLPGGHVITPRIDMPFSARNCFPRSVFRHQGFFIRASAFAALGGYRLDVGSQADGLLMSRAAMQLRWRTDDRPAALFRLDGISNTRHAAVLRSYLHVTAALGLPRLDVLWHQRSYVAKMLLKSVLPARLTSAVIRRRWG